MPAPNATFSSARRAARSDGREASAPGPPAIVVNKGLPDAGFVFEIPKGAEVIRPTMLATPERERWIVQTTSASDVRLSSA